MLGGRRIVFLQALSTICADRSPADQGFQLPMIDHFHQALRNSPIAQDFFETIHLCTEILTFLFL